MFYDRGMAGRSGRPRTPRTERRARVFAALADPTRLRLVELLSGCEEMSGSELARRAGISLALLCHHWSVLAEAGLIVRRKAGQTAYCTLNRALLRETVAALLDAARPPADLHGLPCGPAGNPPRARRSHARRRAPP
ncbi:MAG: hypothetical protein DMG07_09085 [Acidobacteria bacterium]|nr:MAG: hypothetical protein DMG07_09085 [Acidobacteriota bacterium]